MDEPRKTALDMPDLRAYVDALSIDETDALGEDGLRVHDRLAPGGYAASPAGYVAFASTGGNGVHFSIPVDRTGPVVMTVPMAFDGPNMVVGADLKDFLSFGCVYGYFGLEQLAYNKAHAMARIQAAREQSPALQALAGHFDLQPWQEVAQHLAALQRAHPLGPAPDNGTIV